MKLSFIFSILFLASFSQAEVGFKKGNDLTAVLSKGEITVRCNSSRPGSDYAHAFCRQDILLTGEYDYFQGPAGVKADEVTLTARHPDGSKRSKTVNYNSSKGQSTKQVNLWIHTLLQKPLLDGGSNRVSYKMSLKGRTTSQGEFTARVRDGGVKICSRHGYYWSSNELDCRNPYALCSRYFQENNYCL